MFGRPNNYVTMINQQFGQLFRQINEFVITNKERERENGGEAVDCEVDL